MYTILFSVIADLSTLLILFLIDKLKDFFYLCNKNQLSIKKNILPTLIVALIEQILCILGLIFAIYNAINNFNYIIVGICSVTFIFVIFVTIKLIIMLFFLFKKICKQKSANK